MTLGERVTLEELERDPYPIYARLRDEEPVSWVPAVQLWLVTRYDDVRSVDLTPDVFTAATDPSTLNRTMGVNILGSDGPDQQRIRRVVEPPFRPRDVEERTQGMIPALANELIDGFEARGEADLFTGFADPMSVRSLRFMLGLDEVAWEDLLRWNQGLMLGLANFEGDHAKQAPADEASAAMGESIERVLDRLEREPDGSVLSWMAHQRGEDRMTRAEIVANTKLMLSGGLQEPRDLIALAVGALGSHPDQLEAVGANRSLIKPAVEETLRWAGPVGTSTRQTTRVTELAGTELEEGALIGAVLSSANRDPRRFSDPDRFDIHRREGAHLAFAIGDHFCLGAWFGRHLARVSLEILLDRLPNLRLGVPSPGLDVGPVGSLTGPERVPRQPLVGTLSVVRPATEHDADLLATWHADPEVSRYWDDEVRSRERILRDLGRPDVDAYVIEADGEPVGYLQAWFDPEEAGFDMFLVPSARGRGIGPDAARTLASWLVDNGVVRRLITDPYLWNERAIRAWARAGFRRVGERAPDPDRRDPWLLMVFDG